jgi:uncharacterized membrane protein YidH (DUF202 family)
MHISFSVSVVFKGYSLNLFSTSSWQMTEYFYSDCLHELLYIISVVVVVVVVVVAVAVAVAVAVDSLQME